MDPAVITAIYTIELIGPKSLRHVENGSRWISPPAETAELRADLSVVPKAHRPRAAAEGPSHPHGSRRDGYIPSEVESSRPGQASIASRVKPGRRVLKSIARQPSYRCLFSAGGARARLLGALQCSRLPHRAVRNCRRAGIPSASRRSLVCPK